MWIANIDAATGTSDVEDRAQVAIRAAMDKAEQRITHTAGKIANHNAFLVLTDKSMLWYKEHDTDATKCDLRTIFHTKAKDTDPVLVVQIFQGFKLMEPMEILFDHSIDCSVWECLIQRRQLEIFQEECEAKFIASPSVYQRHFAVYKLNRKGVEQERTLVLSSSHLHNLECRAWPLTLKDVKWGFQLGDVTGLDTSGVRNTDIVLQLKPSSNDKAKDKYQFRFLSAEQRHEFIFEVRRLYRWNKGTLLPESM